MANALSRDPYENYVNAEVEQDLIDPDNGIFGPLNYCPVC